MFLLILIPIKSQASVTINGQCFNYLWNPFIGANQYVDCNSSATNVSYSSASVSYLGISSGTSSPDSLSKSSASVSYLGISSTTALSPMAVTYSSASLSYLGISSTPWTQTMLSQSSAAASNLVNQGQYLFDSSVTANYSQIKDNTTTYMLLTASPTFNTSLLQVSSYTALISSISLSYTAISTNSLNVTLSSQAASNLVNQGQYMFTSSQAASNVVNQGQYATQTSDNLKITYSSSSVAYLAIGSAPATAGTYVTYSSMSVSLTNISTDALKITFSSASVAYLGISSTTALPATAVTYSSASISYLGISSSTFNSTVSVQGLDIGTNGRLTTNNQRVGLAFSTYSPVGTYSFTTTSATIAIGSANPVSSMTVTLTSSGTYCFYAAVNLTYNAATFAAVQVISIDLYRQNNTPGVIANSELQPKTRVITTTSDDAGYYHLPVIIYSTVNTNDVLSLQGNITATPSAGSLQANEASLVAVRLY